MVEFCNEVLIEILSWLPVKSLLRFKCVSKRWQTSINDPHFIKLHLNRSIQDPNNYSLIMNRDADFFHLSRPENLESSPNICSVFQFGALLNKNAEVICSCNGLVCLAYETAIYILNPCTRELTRLPDAPTFQCPGYENFFSSSSLWSFGYSSITQEYKVVRCTYLRAVAAIFDDVPDIPYTGPDELKEIKVHTVGTELWRSVKEISDNLLYSGIYLNGALHWLKNFLPDVVISFDVGSEEYVYIYMPIFEGYEDSFLGVLRGLLAVCARQHCDYGVEVWVMNQYGVEESWSHQFRIEMDMFDYLKPLRWLENGVLIEASLGGLCIYDPEEEELRVIPNLRRAVVFVESLVSLKSNEKLRDNRLQVVD